jgi:hypothetical protein
LSKARKKPDDKATSFFLAAIEKYKAAIAENPRLIDALEGWGNTLYEHAKTLSGEERERILNLAIEKYESAVRTKGTYTIHLITMPLRYN